MPKLKQIFNENQLIEKACNNDDYAMTQLLVKYQSKTLKIVNNYVHIYADAQDITQEVLIKLYQSLSSFKFDANFATWHYRVVINTINNHFRENSQRIFTYAVNVNDFYKTNQVPQCFDTPELLLQAEQTVRQKQDSYHSLSQDMRDIVTYRELHGGSYEEIAAKFNCPIGTVRSTLHRARALLKKKC